MANPFVVHLIIDQPSLDEGHVDLEYVSQWMDLPQEKGLRTFIMETRNTGNILVGYTVEGSVVVDPADDSGKRMKKAIKEYDKDAYLMYFSDR